MGVCASSEEVSAEEAKRRREAKIRSKWIDEQLKVDDKTSEDTIKLLFLGAGESGKSTMLKQMRIIHAKERANVFTEEELRNFVSLINSNIIQSTKILLKQSKVLQSENKDANTMYHPDIEPLDKMITGLSYDDTVKKPIAVAIRKIWEDPGIQRTYALRSKYQLNDSTAYFYDRLDAVADPDYKPTLQDILRARIRTTGIVEHNFKIQENDFRMYDVGGQRNARKKWIHCFENVTSVIFVAALSAYDQYLYEDHNTNRMREALHLFEDVLASQFFRLTSMILFLNKKDIFREKIKTVPLTTCFPEYTGSNDYRSTLKFIKAKFKERNHNNERKVYTHYTNATNTDHFEKVFASVQQIILRLHLVDVGLLDPVTELGAEADHEQEADELEFA